MMHEQDAEHSGGSTSHPGLEGLVDGFLMVDADWRITYWNAAAEKMLGVGREVALGRDLWSVLPFLRREWAAERLTAAAVEGKPLQFLAELPTPESGQVSITASPAEGGGLCVQLRVPPEDPPETEQYLTLLQATRSGCVAVDEQWRIVYINSSAEYLLGVMKEGVQGCSIWSLLPADGTDVEDCLKATMADGISRHLQNIRPTNGRRVYHLWVQRLERGGVSILFEDVTKQSRREKRLARLALEAQEANRAKSRFFAAVSHELRTPLNAIIGYTHLLSADTYGDLPDSARRAADRAGMCAEHLAKLVDDLLLLTSAELNRLAPNFGRIEVGRLVRSAVGVYRHRAEAKGLGFEIVVSETLPEVVTDGDRVRQVLGALLSNAVKHTSRGEVTLKVRSDGENVVFSVRDTGPGIPPADRERIFAPFERGGDAARSNPIRHGSGLGLTVAGQLATVLGGSLQLTASSAAGSEFVLALPLRMGEEGPREATAAVPIQMPR